MNDFILFFSIQYRRQKFQDKETGKYCPKLKLTYIKSVICHCHKEISSKLNTHEDLSICN